MTIKASDYIARFLHSRGVTHVFEVIGGMITHMIDSLHQHGGVTIVSVHHEQAAAFAAEGYARVAGVPGVAMATSGPGATNLLTGIGSCYFDSSPAVFITGQVNRHERKGERAIRQLGFQETEIVAMAEPITKAAWLVEDPDRLPAMLDAAFSLALEGRPGPVLLDIPMDVQRCQIADDLPEPTPEVDLAVDPATHNRVLTMLRTARRPLIIAGGGIRSARAIDQFRDFVDRTGVPVVSTLMGVDVLPASHPCRVGMLGSYGNRWANLAVVRSDALLVLGSRLDVRQTGSEAAAFKGDRQVAHVDCDPGEINNRVVGCDPIVAHLQSFLRASQDHGVSDRASELAPWRGEIAALREAWPDTGELPDIRGINPNRFMHQLSACSAAADAFAIDVGQHQMWAAQSLQLAAHQRFLTSGGMGAMGFALPCAIGATFASGRPTVVIAGDGGFQLNLQELETVVRNQLPIKIVVVDNECHGMVRQFQKSYFHERYRSTLWGYSAPDFSRIADAYGLATVRATTVEEIEPALAAMWAEPATPFLLHLKIDTMTDVYPKLAFGHPISEMEPFVKPLEMEGT